MEKKHTLEGLKEEFERAIGQDIIDFKLLSRLSTQLHHSHDDEERKVRVKDDLIQLAINRLIRDLPKTGSLTQDVRPLFDLIVSALQDIENVLKEIKDKVFPLEQQSPKPRNPEEV